MIRHLGYCCQNLSLNGIKTDRTVRIANFTLDKASDIALQNAKDLLSILKWNEENNIKYFRLGSNFFPLMDHPDYGYTINDLKDCDEIKKAFKEAGDYAKTHLMRLSCHPGQYCCIASTNEKVVSNSFSTLEMHGLMGDLLGFGNDFKINIHIGSFKGNQQEISDRFVASFEKLPDNVKNRMTVENDDKSGAWSVIKLNRFIHLRIKVPIVFDYHHWNFCNEGETFQEAAVMAFSTWGDVVPETHMSESNSFKRPTAHSDYLSREIPVFSDRFEYDVALEVKMKDLALLKYRKDFLTT